MNSDTPNKDEVELARLQSLANEGMKLKVCGMDIIMKPMPWLKARSLKNKIMAVLPKLGQTDASLEGVANFSNQIDSAMDEVLDVIAEVLSDASAGRTITRDQLETITEPEVRSVWVAFKHLNEGVVMTLGEVFAPVFRNLVSEITGAFLGPAQNTSTSGS